MLSQLNVGVRPTTTLPPMPLVLALLSVGVAAFVGCGPQRRAPSSNDARRAAWEREWRARQDSIAAIYQARFGLAYGQERGNAASVMPLNAEQQAAIYRLLAMSFFSGRRGADTATGRARGGARVWVEIPTLPHEGGYARAQSLADSVLRALLDTGHFEGACGAAPWPACPRDGAERYAFSAIYAIGPGVGRVFVVRSGTYAHEKIFRVEWRGTGWVVADDMSVMIT